MFWIVWLPRRWYNIPVKKVSLRRSFFRLMRQHRAVDFLGTFAIMYLTGQPEGECRSPDPAKVNTKLSEIAVPKLWREQDGYFLCVKFRIATISKAVLTIKLSSSYVLIIITTFRKDSESGESTSPGCPGKYIILFGCPDIGCRGGVLIIWVCMRLSSVLSVWYCSAQ